MTGHDREPGSHDDGPWALSPSQHDAAAAVAAWFFPPSADYPSSDQADPDGSVLLMVLEQLRPLRAQILAAINAVRLSDVNSHMVDLEDSDADAFELLRVLFVGRYLSCKPVWEMLGYTGRKPRPILEGEADMYLRDGLVEPAIARGKVYRPTCDTRPRHD